jgi:hypothetical protein
VNAYRFGIEWSRLAIRALRAAEPKRAGALCGFARPAHRQRHHAHGRAASFLQSALDQRRGRLDQRGDHSRSFVDYVRQLVAALKEKNLPLEHVQRARHLRLPRVSARRLPAAAEMAARPVPPRHRATWPAPMRRPAASSAARAYPMVRRPEGRHRQELDLFPRLPNHISPWDRAHGAWAATTRSTNSCWTPFWARWRRRASTFIGLNYYGRVRFHHFQAMIPASGAPVKTLKDFNFICDDMVERYPEGMVKILAYLHRKFRLPLYITEHGAASDDEDFRARRLARESRRLAQRDERRGGRARIFLLVAAGQFRMAVWLHQEVWFARGGFLG